MREDIGLKQSRKMRNGRKMDVWLNIQLKTDSGNLNDMDLKDLNGRRK